MDWLYQILSAPFRFLGFIVDVIHVAANQGAYRQQIKDRDECGDFVMVG